MLNDGRKKRGRKSKIIKWSLVLAAPAIVGSILLVVCQLMPGKHESPMETVTLELRTEKNGYLPLEPVRLTAILKNNSDTWFTFTYKIGKPAFTVEYFRVLDDGNMTSITGTACPPSLIICGNARSWFAKPRFLVIDPDSVHLCQSTVNGSDENCFEPGKVTIQAVLTPLRGEHKGKQLKSNNLTIDIMEPQGSDTAAYKFITRRGLVDVGDGRKFGPGFMYGGLIRNSGSHHGRPVHEYFLSNYGNSVYANYVRYTLGTDALVIGSPRW